MISQPTSVAVTLNQQCTTAHVHTTTMANTTMSTIQTSNDVQPASILTVPMMSLPVAQPVNSDVAKNPITVPLNYSAGNLPFAVVNANMLQGASTLVASNINSDPNSSGLLLLNLGNGNGTNLAAAITQLVNAGNIQSVANLAQPFVPTVTSTVAMTTSHHMTATHASIPASAPVILPGTMQQTQPPNYLQHQVPIQQPQNGAFAIQQQPSVAGGNPAAYVLVPLQNGSTNNLNLPMVQTTTTTANAHGHFTNAHIQQKLNTANQSENNTIGMIPQYNHTNSAFAGQPIVQTIPPIPAVSAETHSQSNMLTPDAVLTQESLCNFIKSSTNFALSNTATAATETATALPTIFLPEFSNPASACSSTSSAKAQHINTFINLAEPQISKSLSVPSNNHEVTSNTAGLDCLAWACSGTSDKEISIRMPESVEINNNHSGDVPAYSCHEKQHQSATVTPVTPTVDLHSSQQSSNKSLTSDYGLGAPQVKRQRKNEDQGTYFPNNTVTENGKERKKKGPAPKLSGDETCSICGLKASGFHYNVLSCEGCKGFFRRSVIKNANIHYRCKQQDGNCSIDMQLRRKCQYCRFNKCISVGMRVDCVLSEDKVKLKKLKREIIEKPFTYPGENVERLTPQQLNMLEVLRQNVRRFEWPTADDVQKVTTWNENDDPNRVRAARFAHFTELSILIVQLVVEFTKQLPGFLTVERSDQIVLLKASAIEVMLLRAAKQYNKHDGTISFLNEKMYDKNSFYKAGIQTAFVEPIFAFCESMARLNLDDAEYAMLVAINTFSSDRPHITNISLVERMQDPYIDLLRVYCKIHRPNDPLMFARILMKLVELRTLNNCHSEQMFSLKLQDKRLPPLLAEIWDM